MSPKISLNVSEDVLHWLERFKHEKGKEQYPNLSRTDVFQQDIHYYANLLGEGILSVMEKITYDEFICLVGAFNGLLPNNRTTSDYIKFSIQEYDRYSPEFAWNCEAKGIDKTKLLETVDEFNSMECYALLEYARRFWHKTGESEIDKILEELGLTKEKFKQAS